MFLNVGGAVLGVAVLTVISDSVTSNKGGKLNPKALLEGYRAGYYAAIAMAVIGLVISVFFTPGNTQSESKESEPSADSLREGDEPSRTASPGV